MVRKKLIAEYQQELDAVKEKQSRTKSIKAKDQSNENFAILPLNEEDNQKEEVLYSNNKMEEENEAQKYLTHIENILLKIPSENNEEVNQARWKLFETLIRESGPTLDGIQFESISQFLGDVDFSKVHEA